MQDSSLADAFTLEPETLVFCLIAYGFVASVLPVWMLLAPRDYLSTFMKIGTIVLLAIGIIVTLPVMENPAVDGVRVQRRGPGVRGCAVPVRVHHDRVRRAVRLPLPDRLRHHAEDDREGDAGPLHRLRRDADGVLRRGDGDDRRLDHRPGPVLRRSTRPPASTGGTVQTASEFVNGLGFAITPGGAAIRGHGGRGGDAHVQDRRRADVRARHVRDLRRRDQRRQGLLVPLRDHVRGPVHPHHGGRGHAGRALHAPGHDRQRRTSRSATCRGSRACGSAARSSSARGATSCTSA